MFKTLSLVLIILIVGFFVIWAFMALEAWAERLEDEDHQERLAAERRLREARDDFRYDQEQTARFDDLKKKEEE